MAEALPLPTAKAHSIAGGRYKVYGEIASGGMATVQYGRLVGPGGFAKSVAVKRLHPHFARDPSFVTMFLDEARLAARITHVNVVPTLEVLSEPGEVSVVMEYVHGESLAGLLTLVAQRGELVPVRIAATLLSGVLHGLHAAHETKSEHGEPLCIVHRDVSPQNILVGADGIARLLDFGIAKAAGRNRVTPTGELKGKLAYMAVEQYKGEEVDRRVDVYGASVVLWETLTCHLLFDGPNDAATAAAAMSGPVEPPSALVPEVPAVLDRIVMRGLSRNKDERFATARDMALALEREVGVVAQSELADWVSAVAGDVMAARAALLRDMQQQAEPRGVLETGPVGTRRIASEPPSSGPRPASWQAETVAEDLDPRATTARTPPSRTKLVATIVLAFLIGAGSWLVLRRAPSEQPAVIQAVPAAPAKPESSISVAPPDPNAKPLPEEPVVEAPRGDKKRRAGEPAAERKERPKRDKPAKVDCSEPFVIDAQGIRRPKRECL
jgi:serine/threonine protein kinase